MIPQWRVEQVLRERLADFGVAVELGAGLRGFSQHADGVTATIGDSQAQARYLVGCDGGRSTVRKALGLSLRGQTPDIQLMAVGDVEVDGLGRDAWHQWFTGDGAIMLCPLPGTPTRLFDLFRGPDFTLLGLGERSVARAYGTDALILVRPDGYIGLVAHPTETGSVGEYLRSL